jgi:hypothetical protein
MTAFNTYLKVILIRSFDPLNLGMGARRKSSSKYRMNGS